MKRASFIIIFWAVLGFSTVASAALVVDTGAPTNSWPAVLITGWGQDDFIISQWLAGQFTLKQGYDIDEMQGYLGVNVAGEVRITIYSDSQGQPDTSIFSKTFMSESDQFYGWQGTSGYAGRLDAGTYWIAFEVPVDSPFQGGMGTTGLSSPVMAAEAVNVNMAGVGWSGWWVVPQDSGLGVYARIYGNPVPVPGAVWLLGTGLAGLAAVRKKFRM
ncbi:MAG: VPLPA-CTERM sorting domain-containing protein [Proteobacteria bacterium]|nr:VPLPA-CTERM sorting domain-containing protein [Pseudomonadota bacterium]